MSFPSTGMRAWGRGLQLPLDAALEAFKGAQELQLETSAHGVSLSQDPHGSGGCWVGFLEKPGILSSSLAGGRNRPGSGTRPFLPFPYSHPCSEGPPNLHLSTWTVQIPAPATWVFPTSGVLQIPILQRHNLGKAPGPIHERPGPAGTVRCDCSLPSPLETSTSPSRCEFRSSES